MVDLNQIFFPVWYFFGDFLFGFQAFLIVLGIIFSLIYQFWKRP